MSKIYRILYGKMVEAIDLETNKTSIKYGKHINKPGLFYIARSEHKYPGKHFIYLFPNDADTDQQAYFHTSCGKLTENENRIELITNQGKYTFEIGDFDLTEEDKQLLYLNVFY